MRPLNHVCLNSAAQRTSVPFLVSFFLPFPILTRGKGEAYILYFTSLRHRCTQQAYPHRAVTAWVNRDRLVKPLLREDGHLRHFSTESSHPPRWGNVLIAKKLTEVRFELLDSSEKIRPDSKFDQN